jgi:hypothetical protein
VSGIASCTPGIVLSSDRAGQIVSGICTNNAGLDSSVLTISGINIDTTPPSVAISIPAEGGVYPEGATVLASFACADTLSGITSCNGTVASGVAINTRTKGAKSFTVTGKDRAGNTVKRTVSYTVR